MSLATADFTSLLSQALGATGDGDDATDERILDGALEAVAAYGTRRTTMDDVASRSGLGRMTVFRRFGTKDALIERLLVREVRRFLDAVDAALAPISDPSERVAEAFVACVRAGARHPLIARLVRVEPGAALQRLSRGNPSPLELGRAYVAAQIAADRRERGAPGGDADEIADVLVRLAVMYVFVPSPVVDVRDEDAARDFALRVLAPIL
jgi:AcrR family transcriptional regulator